MLLILLLCSCASPAGGDAAAAQDESFPDWLQTARFGVLTGSTIGPDVQEHFPDAPLHYYNTMTDMLTALKSGRVDAVGLDEGVYRFLITDDAEIAQVGGKLSEVSMAPIFQKSEKGQALCDQYNEFIRKLKADGTLDQIDAVWFGQDDSLRTVTDYEKLPDVNGTLTMAIDSSLVPFAYMKDGKFVGYDVDIMARFCEAYGYRMQVVGMTFDGILAAVQSGKCDFAASNITITDERAEQVLFGEPDFQSGNVVVVLKTGSDPAAGGQIPPEQLKTARIGVQTGTTYDEIVLNALPDAKIHYFNSYADIIAALESNKIDAFPGDEPVMRLLVAENRKLTILDNELDHFELGIVLPKSAEGEALRDEMNAWLAEMKESGELEALILKWTDGDEKEKILPDYPSFPAPKGTLRMVTEAAYAPMNYVSDNQITGLEVDLAARFCEDNGYGLKVSSMNFDGILPAIQQGKADFAIAAITITDERSESVNFSDPYYTGGTVLVTLKAENGAGSNPGFFEGIAGSFEKTFIREDRWKLFAEGVMNTLIITLLAILFGTALGFGVFMLCRNGNRLANGVTRFVTWLVQGMPVVVLLMILYYIVFGKSAISGIAVSVIGFTLTFGATVFSLLKMGVGAVDRGQYEAAYALGYTNTRTFFNIILPQALPHVLPAYKGEIVSLIKATAVVGYIAVLDLTKMGDIVRSRTYEAFFPLIAITVIYFLLEGLLGFAVKRITVGVDPKKRKPEKILKGVKTDD